MNKIYYNKLIVIISQKNCYINKYINVCKIK
jgi:hypothetical protein